MHKLFIIVLVVALVLGGLVYLGGARGSAAENGSASVLGSMSKAVKKIISDKKQANPGVNKTLKAN